MKRYDQIFTLKINETKEEMINVLKKKGKVTTIENAVILNHNPPWYDLFAGRGIITINFQKDHVANESVTECILSPSIADARTIAVFLMWNIPLWAGLLYFFPWNIILAGVFFIEWIMMAFIAIPIMFLAILIISIYILSISHSGPTLFYIVITWSFFWLLINATMRYNRGELKKWVVRTFVKT